MTQLTRCLPSLLLLLLFLATPALAQEYRYYLYLDFDADISTGCSEAYPNAPGQAQGAEFRLTAVVNGDPQMVSQVLQSVCGGAAFGPDVQIGGGYPVALNVGVDGADAVELSVFGPPLGLSGTNAIRLEAAARTNRGNEDVLLTRDGSAGGGPIVLGIPFAVPTLGVLGGLILALLLVFLASRAQRQWLRRSLLSVGLLLGIGSSVAGTLLVADGDIGDWAGTGPLALDPAGDASGNDSAADIRALFAGLSGNELVFRLDIVDVENQPPVANPQAVTTLEDTPLVITLSGSDPDGDALTFSITTQPAFGTLGSITQLTPTTASVTYTPNADVNGGDSFAFTVNDGQVNALLPALVSITITPVNDAPSFTASNPPAVLEDAGAQSLAFATFSPGPANEVGQMVLAYSVTAVSNPALFAAGPTIANNGTLSYTPAANANGSSTFTVTVQDDGGTANGGIDTSAPQTFTISVTAVNDAPSFVVGPNQTVLEDAGPQTVTPWATAISAGPPDEAGQTLSFNITGNSNAALFSAGPTVSPTGQLSYTPAANAAGTATITLVLMDDGGTANGGVDTSAPQSFTITITGVNDAPVFTAGPNQTVNEDAGAQSVAGWATGIDDGDPEVTQGLTFNVTGNTNAALFSAGPAVSPTGTLSYTPAADANGTATITIVLMDDGGTANGGVDTSAPQSFDITITAVNDAPSFTAGPNQTVLEDGGAQTVLNWATALSAGPPDEAGQTLSFNVTGNTNAGLFAAGPTISPTGDLSYTPAANANGTATITITLMDDGGTANGGMDTSAPQSFTISVTAVNDEPSFVAGPDVTVNEDAGPQSSPWATAITAGPPDESGQLLTFLVSNDNNALFAVQPAVSPTGVLSFTSVANATGSAMVTVSLMDNGGTANGGDDTSPSQTFQISITAVNDAPVNTLPANRTVDEDTLLDFTGANLISVADVDIAGGMLTVNLQTNNGLLNVTAAGAATLIGNGTGDLQINGILADANATLASLTYQGIADYNGPDNLSVGSNDNGNTGAGGPQADVDVIAITVNPINDAPVNTVPGMQTVTGMTLEFSTVNGNAISVFDVDADPGTMAMDLTVNTGTLSAVPTPGVMITGNGSNGVTLEGLQADINTAMDGLVYTPAGGGSVTLQVSSDDLGNTGAGGPLNDTDNITILIDSPPIVINTVPAQGGVIASNGIARIDISEQVNLANGGIVLNCLPSGTNFVQGPVANDNTFGYLGFGQPGDDCTITVISTLMTDVDTIDPPDQLDGNNDGDGVDGDVDNFVLSYSIDAAPTVTTTSPMNGDMVANNANLIVNFSEPVNLSAASFTLECPGGVPFAGGFAVSGSGTATATINPTGDLPAGNCQLTVIAANTTDVDAFDPPDNLPGNVVVNFSVDAAPMVTGSTPPDSATQVATDTAVSFDFDEAVNGAAGAITLNCGGPIAGTLSGSGGTTLSFTPGAALPENTLCTATAVAAQISDVDGFDPPNNPGADFVISFTTDAAPTVLSTVPANGALLQSPSDPITINFSESVNFDTTANAANVSFDLECPAATNFSVVTASPASSVVLDPDNLAIAGQTCTLTIRAAGISDADAGDPPDNLAADVVVTIEYDDPAIAMDDAYSVTPHLLLNIGAGAPQGGGVLGNDTIGGTGSITGFGPAGNCNLVVPNGTNAAASTAGGRVVLSLDGSFSYGPPAGLVDNALPTPEDSFCYTLTGGSVGTVAFNLALTELVWFVNAGYAGANGMADGTQQRPFPQLISVASVDTANDTVHIAASGTAYGNPGFILESGERVIGAGSGSDLATITGIAPVAGSAFPLLAGASPTINCIGPCDLFTLGSNNTLRGLILANQQNGANIAGTGFGTLTVAELTINSPNGQALALTNGTLSGVFVDIDVSSGGGQGISLNAVGGTWSVTGNVGIGNVSGTALNIINTPAGGSATFTGGLTINKTSSGAGVNFNANAAPINLGVVSVTTGAGPALTLDNSSGTVTITGPGTVSATGGPALNSSSSVLAINLSSASSTNSSTQGINLNNISGTVSIGGGAILNPAGTAFLAQGTLGTVSYGGNITKDSGTSTGRLVDVGAGASGALTLSGTLSCQGACNSGGAFQAIRVNGRSGGTISFTGDKTLAPNPALTNTLVQLTGNAGATISFSGTTRLGSTVVPTQGTAFAASGGGVLNLNDVLRTDTNGGRAFDIDGMTLSGTMSDVMFSNGALGVGVPLIEITNSAAPSGVTFGQSLTFDHDDAGESGGGIRLQNNTGTYNFPRVTTINSTNTPALFAANAGTINVGNISAGALINDGGIAIDVQNTTVGTGGIVAARVQSVGGVNGIILNNTGTNPALTVLGTGTPGSGGTISNKTGDGVRLESTQGVTLNFVNLTNTASTNGPGPCGTNLVGNTGCNAAIDMLAVANITLNGLSITGDPQYGINGNGVAAFILDNSTINGAGNEVQEDGVRFINLTGTSRIRNSTLQNSHDNHLRVYNTVATALNLTVDETVAGTSRFLSTVVNDGINIEGINSANMTLSVLGTDFDSSVGDHIQTAIDDSATMSITIQNNVMTANANPAVLGSGITLSSSGDYSGSKLFNISNNSINGANAKAINVNMGTTIAQGGTGTYSGTVANNAIGTGGVAESGGFGIDVLANGGGTITTAVTGNTIRQFLGDHGIRVLHRDGSGRINATVTNNTVAQPEPGGFNGVIVQSGGTSGPPIDASTICLDISGNTLAGSGAGGGSSTDFRLRQRFNTTFQLRGYGGAIGDTAAVVAYVQGVNPGGESGSATAETVVPTGSGFINTPGGAACPLP